MLRFRWAAGPVKCSHIYSPSDSEFSELTVIKYNFAYIFTAGTDCRANEKLPRQSRLTSSRVLWMSSPQLLFCRWHSISFFSSSCYFLPSFFAAFTCRVAAAVSKGGKKTYWVNWSKEEINNYWLAGFIVLFGDKCGHILAGEGREYFPGLSLDSFVFF